MPNTLTEGIQRLPEGIRLLPEGIRLLPEGIRLFLVAEYPQAKKQTPEGIRRPITLLENIL